MLMLAVDMFLKIHSLSQCEDFITLNKIGDDVENGDCDVRKEMGFKTSTLSH